MDSDKIIVVSGEPRSGTSMMMQTMEALGLDFAGEEFPQEAKIEKILERIEDEDKKEEVKKNAEVNLKHARKMNPHGFYEIPGVVVQGIRHMRDEYKGKVIKIITNGVYERETPNGQIIGTPSKYIDKMVMCLRDPRHIAISQKDLTDGVEVAGVDENGIDQWINAPKPISPKRYIQSMGHFIMWVAENRNLDDKILTVDFEEMHNDKPIEKIAAHLGLTPTEEQLQAARDNIDPLLKRSTEFDGWGDNDIEGALAEEIYDALKKWDIDKFGGLGAQIEEMIRNDALEDVRWVDTEFDTWVTIPPVLYRKGLDKITPIQDVLNPKISCKYYSEDEKNTYTIKRPIDIGDLERPMVNCKRDCNLYTCEYCKHCWQRGSFHDGVEYEGQRHRGENGLLELTDNEKEHKDA